MYSLCDLGLGFLLDLDDLGFVLGLQFQGFPFGFLGIFVDIADFFFTLHNHAEDRFPEELCQSQKQQEETEHLDAQLRGPYT